VNSWPGGFQAEVTVTNNGATVLNGWSVRMTLANGQAISSMWNATNTGTTGAVTARNASYNGTLAGHASTTFGFTATGNSAPAPSDATCSSP
jgi:cellulase/cellobiase CelA1